MLFFQSGNPQAAEKNFRKLASKHPGHAAILSALGAVLVSIGKHGEAAPYLRSALKADPSSYVSLYNLGIALKALGQPNEAYASLKQAIGLNPQDPDLWNNRGTVLNDMRQYEAAIADFDKAISLKPNYAQCFCNKGKSLIELGRDDDALAAFDAASKINPELIEIWLGFGRAFGKLKQPGKAAAALQKAIQIDRDHPFLKGNLLHQKMLACDWPGTDELIAEIESDLIAGKPSADPFGWQGIATSSRSLQLCAQIYNKTKFPAGERTQLKRGSSSKIRIGYVAGEFRQQATSILLTGVLEHHDKDAFEIYAFDNGWDDGSDMRKRIESAVHRIVPIKNLSDAQAATTIADSDIDILVNLNGYFGAERTAVFARRPARVQVNYLGFPGTLGADYMDYIIADACVIPPGERTFYNEKVVYLPDCYQANDDKRPIADRAFTRAELGLPELGFVFCCFNNTYKITPRMFDVWMRILSNVPGSVLWLFEDNADARVNLQNECAARGVESSRLVFAGLVSSADHLARHACADLFLDTLPYNAHTTASDALWAGLPVLTCPGETFAGRVAASLLKAIHLPELVTSSPENYERLAIHLATQPEKLAEIRQRLAANRTTTSLFDTARYTKHLEQSYRTMHQRQKAGSKPDHFTVAK